MNNIYGFINNFILWRRIHDNIKLFDRKILDEL